MAPNHPITASPVPARRPNRQVPGCRLAVPVQRHVTSIRRFWIRLVGRLRRRPDGLVRSEVGAVVARSISHSPTRPLESAHYCPCVSAGTPGDLDGQVAVLFALVSQALAKATDALLTGNRAAGQEVVDADAAIDELTHDIERLVWEQIDSGTPGRDQLRHLVGLLLILPELERERRPGRAHRPASG